MRGDDLRAELGLEPLGRVNGMKAVSSPMWYLAARLQKNGRDVHVAVSVTRTDHQVDVLEGAKMERGLVTVTAEALKNGLANDGKVVLDGILFDHDKATIKPESKAARLPEAGILLAPSPAAALSAGPIWNATDQAARRALPLFG